jgi:hypothetical protein
MFTGRRKEEDHVVFAEADIPVADNKHMSEFEMSKYRYQIDLGGGTYFVNNRPKFFKDPSISPVKATVLTHSIFCFLHNLQEEEPHGKVL